MKKPRKRYPSDRKTTLRVTPQRHSQIVKAAEADGRTIEKFVDMTFEAVLKRPAAPQIIRDVIRP